MANEQNLRPFNTMTPEQRREISQKGGKASGAARRAKRERINAEKAAIWAQKEQRHDEISFICSYARQLRRMSR